MTVLLTGAAGGIGAAAADFFLARGWQVYAIDITPIPPREGLIPLCADITDPTALARVAADLAARDVTLDAMLLAAGIHRMVSLVETDADALRRVMEVNALGTMQTVRAFHPLLAARGRVVIVTSEVGALAPLPFNGLYSVSKATLEAYAQALRQELGLLGQTVVTVRPGAVATPLCSDSLSHTEQLTHSTVLYRSQSHRFLSLTRACMGRPITPDKLAPTLFRAVTAKHPRLSYAKHRNLGLVLLGMLPLRLQCFIIRVLLNRK